MHKCLIISEGPRDSEIVNRFFQVFKDNKDISFFEFRTNIYVLYKELREKYNDDLEFIDIIPILRNCRELNNDEKQRELQESLCNP